MEFITATVYPVTSKISALAVCGKIPEYWRPVLCVVDGPVRGLLCSKWLCGVQYWALWSGPRCLQSVSPQDAGRLCRLLKEEGW